MIATSAFSADHQLEDALDSLFQEYSLGVRPGYAIGIMRQEKLILAKGFGFADMEGKKPITVDTAFNLASLSKQFTGAAVAFELEKGTIKIDDRLAVHWPGLPEFMSEITIAHLIYMTSGLKEYYTLPSPKGGWRSEDRFMVEDAMGAVFKSGTLDFKPGSRWSYSNINYQLLAVLTARLNGLPFARHMEKEIFEPLDMRHSWVDAPIDSTRPYKAKSYIRAEQDNSWQLAPRLSPHYGGSGVFASLNDLAKWNRALFYSEVFGDKFKKIMLSTRRFQHDKDNDAIGLVYGSYQGTAIIWYEGGDYGVSTYMVHLPERDETVICLSNFGDGRCGEKARSIMDLLILHSPTRISK